MKFVLLLFQLLLFGISFSQTQDLKHNTFCKNLKKVFELARTGNLDTYDGIIVKKSPFLAVPDYSIQLERFATNYVDKDERFVARTNMNLDSLTALNTLDEYRSYVNYCLDSVQWNTWEDIPGDDGYTPFFKELKQTATNDDKVNLRLAIVTVAPKIYSINLYITRRK